MAETNSQPIGIDRTSPPAYWIIFAETSPSGPYQPVVPLLPALLAEGTVHHGLDRSVVPTLPVLHFCLHLPRWFGDLSDPPASVVMKNEDVDLSQHIVLVPSFHALALDAEYAKMWPPTVVFAPDQFMELAEQVRAKHKAPLPCMPFSQAVPASLPRIWKEIALLYPEHRSEMAFGPAYVSSSDRPGLALPLAFLERQLFAPRLWQGDRSGTTSMDLVGRMIHLKGFVRAVESFNKERATSEVLEAEMPERIRRNRERLRFPVSVLAPGLPSIYLRRTGEERPNQAKSEPAELEAFSFLSTHRAIARSGLGFVTPPVPQQLFNKIDQLEVHVLEARPNGLKILKMLRGIGLDAAALIPQEAVLSLRRAGDVTIFSNFPLGLSILGGHTSPLCCSRPVWYRPLLPLTSAMQMEVNPPDGIYLGHSMRVLVLDCLQPDDPVRTMCSAGWHAIKTLLSGVKSSSFAQVNVRTEDEFRAALLANPSEILILCAHGQYLRDANSASVVIGDVPTQLTNLEGLPPVVLLSSCATSPRGVGAVSVADLLLRGGALAVISTLIPILASRNALLMMRFFEYLSLAVSGKAPLRTLADVWQATASTNALFDILTTSDRIATWAREPHANGDVVSEFMIRSAKRVRMTHLYEDTQLILEEIARDRGFLDVLRSTLKSQGFLPETLFYTMLGWPERIIVRDDVVERMNGRA